jgi:hypothetical protein
MRNDIDGLIFGKNWKVMRCPGLELDLLLNSGIYISKTLFSANKSIDIHPTVQYTEDKYMNTIDARTAGIQHLEGQICELRVSLNHRVCDAKYAIPTF